MTHCHGITHYPAPALRHPSSRLQEHLYRLKRISEKGTLQLSIDCDALKRTLLEVPRTGRPADADFSLPNYAAYVERCVHCSSSHSLFAASLMLLIGVLVARLCPFPCNHSLAPCTACSLLVKQ